MFLDPPDRTLNVSFHLKHEEGSYDICNYSGCFYTYGSGGDFRPHGGETLGD